MEIKIHIKKEQYETYMGIDTVSGAIAIKDKIATSFNDNRKMEVEVIEVKKDISDNK